MNVIEFAEKRMKEEEEIYQKYCMSGDIDMMNQCYETMQYWGSYLDGARDQKKEDEKEK